MSKSIGWPFGCAICGEFGKKTCTVLEWESCDGYKAKRQRDNELSQNKTAQRFMVECDERALVKSGGLASDKSLRDYFAGQAIGTGELEEHSHHQHDRAKWAYQQADAMLKARGESDA
ncbi:MAG: hypothetical protein JKY52_08430 [Flavobacteriales bacterium]|nr:hypothetical protein [Flavobacteriales bacterium]